MDSSKKNEPLVANSDQLHLAVVHNNLDLIKRLLAAGCDVNAENSSGNTPLLTALKSKNFEAAKILLDADASVHVTDVSTGNSALKILITELRRSRPIELAEDVVPRLVDNLKRSDLDVVTIAELFVAAECPIRYVLSVKDAQLARKFLERDPSIDHISDMQLFIERRDLENVETIFRYGSISMKNSFYQVLRYMMKRKEQWELWKVFIEHLSDWDVVGEVALFSLPLMFLVADTKSLRVLLDSKLPLQVKQTYGIDVRIPIFGNSHGDAVQLLQDPDFNVNESNFRGSHALHYAADYGLAKNVQLLLDSAAEVNIKDGNGQTALFKCTSQSFIRSGRLLLEHGADVQVIGNEGTTLFELARGRNSLLLGLLIAQLAIAYTKGEPIKQAIQNEIESNEDDKKIYETCCQQLQVLKTSTVVGSITLFTVLAETIDKLDRSLCDEKTIVRLEQCIESQQRNVHSLYYDTLKTKLIQATNLYEFKCKLASLITKNTGTLVSFDNLVIEEICKYCTRRDIKTFIDFKSPE